MQKYCEHRRWSAANTQRFLEPGGESAAGAKRFGQGLMFRTVRITRLYPGRKCKETVRRNAGRRGAHFLPELGKAPSTPEACHRQALSKGTDISPPALQAAGRFLLLPAFPSLPARRAAHLYKGRYRLEARFARILKQKLIFPHQRLYAEAA